MTPNEGMTPEALSSTEVTPDGGEGPQLSTPVAEVSSLNPMTVTDDNDMPESTTLSQERPDMPAVQAAQDALVAESVSTTDTAVTYTNLGWAFRIVFALASTVGGLSSIAIKQLLLPLQVSMLAPTTTNTSFAIVASIGAFAGLIVSPFTGALSDRSVAKWGPRRVWIVFGLLAGVLGLVIMAFAASIPVLLLGEIIAQIGVDTVLSTVAAIIPDQVPAPKRAFFSALNGMAPIVGGVLGLLAVSRLTNTHVPEQGYLALIILSVLFIVLFLLVFRDRPGVRRQDAPEFQMGPFLAGFVRPLASGDFVYTLISRCLVFLSFQILGAYTLFYLRGVLHFSAPQAASGVANFQLISTACLLIGSLIVGSISGKSGGRIKPFVILGALLMAISLVVIALVHVWTVMLLIAVVFGFGFGIYLAVDMALAIRVLPTTTDNGKDLAIINTAIFLPLIISPIIGAFILNLSHNNFSLLFLIAAFSSVVAAGLILPIRGVR
ncbi:MFS transporter [Dictyobacter aurantiacus]|uniref:MFS transporter n=1 Tax=Dictyobacter aurantiacus TaxID=1936993 RepID=A0A401ZJ86_9CHLR|nr:MFS transporter [Dictyobacter aurantiacus]GCE06921.1 MFS transporter [Dictyobacter aurantiacus]